MYISEFRNFPQDDGIFLKMMEFSFFFLWACFHTYFYGHKIHRMEKKQQQSNLNCWLRPGVPSRFQDPVENMTEDIETLLRTIAPPALPVSPQYIPNSPEYDPTIDAVNDDLLPLPLVRESINAEESYKFDRLLCVCEQLLSVAYANNHAIRDVCAHLGVVKGVRDISQKKK